MRSRSLLIVRLVVIVAAAFALLLVGLNQANAIQEGPGSRSRTALTEGGDGGPIVQATERISIPYGFHAVLPLLNGGTSVRVSGEGACTPAGEPISIAVTVTQSLSGASATDTWNGTCTGERQVWTKIVTVTSGPDFSGGAAHADAFATAPDVDGEPSTRKWDSDVFLARSQAFLPIATKP